MKYLRLFLYILLLLSSNRETKVNTYTSTSEAIHPAKKLVVTGGRDELCGHYILVRISIVTSLIKNSIYNIISLA